MGRFGALREVLSETVRDENQVPEDEADAERAHADEDVMKNFDAPRRGIDDDEPESAANG